MEPIRSVSNNRTYKKRITFASLKAVDEYSGNYEVDEIVRRISDVEECGLLTPEQASQLIKKYRKTWSTEKKQLFMLLFDIESIVLPEKLSEVLIKLELPDIQENVQTCILEFARHQSTAEFPHSAFLRKTFYKYKSWCDDNEFESRRIGLRVVFEAFLKHVKNAATIEECDKWGDALTIIWYLHIQQHTQDDDIEHHIDEFTVRLPANVNSTLPNILWHCKMAIIAALRSDWDSAEMINQAITSSQNYNDFAIRYMVHHTHIYILQLKLKHNWNTENQLQALQVCDRFLDIISSEVIDDFSTLAVRSFCLYKVFILLRVGPYFEILEDTSQNVPLDDIRIGEQMLDRVETSFNPPDYPVEDRRRMMFCILKARIYQLQGRYLEAQVNVCSAKIFMNRGTPYTMIEKTNLNNFRAILFQLR